MKLSQEELVTSFIEIELTDAECFLKVKETLTRIGISNSKRNKLTQTAHILQKRGKYYIVHFLQLFMLDGKEANFVSDDSSRVVSICELLQSWGLINVVSDIDDAHKNLKPYQLGLTIIDFKSKKDWELTSKYTIGNK